MVRRRKMKEADDDEERTRSFGDLFRRKPRKPETIEEALMGGPGPFDRPGHMTGWKPSPDGRLVPYKICLPRYECDCGRVFVEEAHLAHHRKLEGHGK